MQLKVMETKAMQEKDNIGKDKGICHCEQCGKSISANEYQIYGCVCFDCWVENETGFKD